MKSIGFAALLTLAACSKEPSQNSQQTSTSATAGTGGTAAAGTFAGASGNATTGSGGAAAMSGAGGAPAASSGGSNAATGTGGSASPTTNDDAGRTIDAGTSNAGSNHTGACTRELLKTTIDAYFDALAAHDPSSLQLAGAVKFTENGEVLQLGQGLWESAGAVKYTQSALDTETCGSATQAVVPDGSMDIPFGLRLALEDQRITEVETIAVRPGDYKVLGSDFASDPAAIIAAGDAIHWQDSVARDQRNTRDEIASWIDKYFRIFPRGVCDVTGDCKRLENGGGSFGCDFGASCDPGPPSGTAVMEPRLILVDVEAGIGVGFTMFMGNTDMHMYKMYGGQVHAVHTILGAASGSGWD